MIVLLLAGFLASANAENPAAVVNGERIEAKEYEDTWSAFLADRKKTLKPEVMTPQWEQAARKGVLDTMINQRLLLQAAKKAETAQQKKEIDARVKAARAKLRTDGKAPESRIEEILRKQARIAVHLEAVTRRRVSKPSETEVRTLFEAVRGRMGNVEPARDEFQARLDRMAAGLKIVTGERVVFRHIFTRADEKASAAEREAARAKIEELKGRLEKGESFEDVARKHSEDKITAEKGGLAGYASRGQLNKELEDALFAIPVGSVSGVVTTRLGYHLIRIDEKRPAVPLRFEDARKALAEQLTQDAILEEQSRYLAELRKAAVVKVP